MKENDVFFLLASAVIIVDDAPSYNIASLHSTL